jgi:GH25 family lysozyme M1 (1,4-beta-N-acetylmuramidase)
MATNTPDSDGPDISHWNPIADWNDIPEFDLWCMKATEGKSFRSPVFNTNWAKCRELKVMYLGAYHWIRSDSTMTQQVANLKRAIDDHDGLRDGEFVMLDWETTPGIPNVTVAQVEEWIKIAEEHWAGKIIVYASDWVPGFKTWRKKNPDYPLWYANYRLVDDARGGKAETDLYGADVWQWTSSAKVSGFSDDTIDMNDVLDWSWFETLRPSEEPAVEPPVTVKPPVTPSPITKPAPPPSKGPKLNWLNDLILKSSGNIPNTAMIFQSLIKSLGYSIQVDGFYGPQSEGACRWFQQMHNLTVDGWVGPKTWNALASDGPFTIVGEKDAG